LLYKLAPFISLLTAFAVYAIIPFGASASGQTWAIGNVNAGILLISQSVRWASYGICLGRAGHPGSKYPLLGSVRSSRADDKLRAGDGRSLVGRSRSRGNDVRSTASSTLKRVWWFVLPQFVGCVNLRKSPPSRRRIGRAVRSVEAETELVAGFHTRVLGVALRSLLYRRVTSIC